MTSNHAVRVRVSVGVVLFLTLPPLTTCPLSIATSTLSSHNRQEEMPPTRPPSSRPSSLHHPYRKPLRRPPKPARQPSPSRDCTVASTQAHSAHTTYLHHQTKLLTTLLNHDLQPDNLAGQKEDMDALRTHTTHLYLTLQSSILQRIHKAIRANQFPLQPNLHLHKDIAFRDRILHLLQHIVPTYLTVAIIVIAEQENQLPLNYRHLQRNQLVREVTQLPFSASLCPSLSFPCCVSVLTSHETRSSSRHLPRKPKIAALYSYGPSVPRAILQITLSLSGSLRLSSYLIVVVRSISSRSIYTFPMYLYLLFSSFSLCHPPPPPPFLPYLCSVLLFSSSFFLLPR